MYIISKDLAVEKVYGSSRAFERFAEFPQLSRLQVDEIILMQRSFLIMIKGLYLIDFESINDVFFPDGPLPRGSVCTGYGQERLIGGSRLIGQGFRNMLLAKRKKEAIFDLLSSLRLLTKNAVLKT